jgi:hypothetical protein
MPSAFGLRQFAVREPAVGKDDDLDVRERGCGADELEHLAAVVLGHHQVEDDQVRPAGVHPPHGLQAVGGHVHREPLLQELFAVDLNHHLVVIDEQDFFHGRSGAGPIALPPADGGNGAQSRRAIPPADCFIVGSI